MSMKKFSTRALSTLSLSIALATGAVMRRPSRISRRVGLAGTEKFTVRGSLGMRAIFARRSIQLRAGAP